MKFEDSPLKEYLVKHLQPLTPADPVILADYIIALLKKDKPLKELQDLCAENLVDFLGQSTESFVSKLFLAIQDGPVALPLDSSKLSKMPEPPSNEPEQVEVKPSKDDKDLHIKEEERLSSETAIDSDELEVSDDDDDRNHKHRKRAARHPSFQKNDLERAFRKPNRNFDKSSGDRKFFDASPSINRSKYDNNSFEKSSISKFERKFPGTTSVAQAPQDLGPRSRFRNDSGPRFDSPASVPRPAVGRGRGRGGSGPWTQHDSRFGSLGTLDFASHMIPQASTHPGMFMGATISSVAGAQPASWGAFGFIPGMGNGCLDPVNPLGLQGTLHSQLNPQLNLSIPRPRCRDFEEQGFCLRGDMCPMEHGMNRIVVEDVQSLSQFNLPVSLSSSRGSGQAGPGTSTIASSNLAITNKNVPSKTSKSSATGEVLGLNGALSSAVAESDVYDPDQPLWNNSNQERSNNLPLDPSRDIDEKEIFWDGDPSEFQRFRSLTTEQPSSSVGDVVLQGREKANSGKTSKVPGGTDKQPNDVGLINRINQAKREVLDANSDSVSRVFATTIEANHMSNMAPISRFRKDKRNTGKTSQKALRTLFVNGIPQNNNRREALFSHFKKFGTIVDIYIPLKSEKAFVQFSSREEAEAALKAPDAVMGNRFIKLFWANRDNLSDEQVGNELAGSVFCSAKFALSIPAKSSAGEVKESSPSLTPKTGSVPFDVPVVSPALSKPLVSNASKLLLAQKRRDSLEALKEELRRKQESLAKKRNEFRSQLNKLEKQTMSAKKSGPVLESTAKKQKVEKGAEMINLPIFQSETDNKGSQNSHSLHKTSCPESNLLLTDGKVALLVNDQSPKSSSRNDDLHLPSPNSSEANNTISFRLFPPIPAALANLSTLEEHFSSFHDLSSVELVEQERTSSSGCLKQSSNSSAIVTFKTRGSAEKAFYSGTSWQGHDLRFSWLSTSDSGTVQEAEKDSSRPSDIEMLDEVQSELLNTKSLLPSPRADSNSLVETGKDREHQDGHHCEFFDVKCSRDSSLLEKCLLDSGTQTTKDGNSIDASQ